MVQRKENPQPRVTLVRPRPSLAMRFASLAGKGWQAMDDKLLTHQNHGTWVAFESSGGGGIQASISFTDAKTPKSRRDESHKIRIIVIASRENKTTK